MPNSVESVRRLPRGAACMSTVAAMVALCLVHGTAAIAAPSTDQSERESRIVLAYYYAWWEPERISGALYTPTQSYPSGVRQLVDDPALLREHIREAQAAGIDGFIVNRVSDMAVLLPLAREAGFSVSLHLAGDESELRDFYRYKDDPAIVRYQDHPVLFFWQSGAPGNDYWSAVRQSVDPDHNVLWIADGDKFDILQGDAWDGISPYAIAWSANPGGQLVSWASQARRIAPGKLYIPPVSPGCDDSLARAPTCIRDRADGAYYRASWQGALDANPPWAVVVSTFNEWMEATQIEPSVQYGDQYLQLTREFADRFRGTAAVASRDYR